MTRSNQTTTRRATKLAAARKSTPGILPDTVWDASNGIAADIATEAFSNEPTSAAMNVNDASQSPSAPNGTTKLGRLVALLQRPEGASLAELCAVTDWQAHSVRGALAGTLKHKGYTITSERVDGTRRYRTTASV